MAINFFDGFLVKLLEFAPYSTCECIASLDEVLDSVPVLVASSSRGTYIRRRNSCLLQQPSSLNSNPTQRDCGNSDVGSLLSLQVERLFEMSQINHTFMFLIGADSKYAMSTF